MSLVSLILFLVVVCHVWFIFTVSFSWFVFFCLRLTRVFVHPTAFIFDSFVVVGWVGLLFGLVFVFLVCWFFVMSSWLFVGFGCSLCLCLVFSGVCFFFCLLLLRAPRVSLVSC